MLSERVNRIALSPTLRIAATATQMRAEGVDVVDFSIGEPDFPTPSNVKKAGSRAIDQDFTKYTANDGIPELRKAICAKLKADNGLVYAPDEVIASPGAKASLYFALTALLDDGEDVIIPAPYWVSYPDMVRLCKAHPVFVPAREEDGFKLTPRDLRAAITFNTKALILNYPSNPCGTTYTREELEAIADICVRDKIHVVADEIYEKITYDGFRPVSIGSLGPAIKALTVTINGFSKAYSMTGWRMGYAAGPKDIVQAMSKVQSHATSNPTSIAQKAALEALVGPQMDVQRMAMEFQRRRNAILYRLRAMPRVTCYEPKGAFYVFPNVAHYFDREYQGTPIRNSYGMSYYLLKVARVAVVPGDAFGAEGFIRLSFATSMERIEEGMRRVGEALARLEPARKGRPAALNNVHTKVQGPAPVDGEVGLEVRNALVAECEAHLGFDSYFEWNANLGGLVVQLRTNSPHLADFYAESFYPAQLEADLEPHAVLYAVKDVPGREPRAFYHAETRTGVVFNTAWYGQVRQLAVGMAADVGERMGSFQNVRAACLDHDGKGMLLLGAPGVGKTGLIAALLGLERVKLVSTDYVAVRFGPTEAIAEAQERKLYLQTSMAGAMPPLARLFDRSKLENVAMRREQCENGSCPDQGSCRIDRGLGHCYTASPVSRGMLDPYWIGGADRHVKRTIVRSVVLVRREPVAPALEELTAAAALAQLERFAEAASGPIRSTPFLNPYLLVRAGARLEQRRAAYRRLLSGARVYSVNMAAGSAESVRAVVRTILERGRAG
jgi:aspartate/methionine/tyrosine aminotransferase